MTTPYSHYYADYYNNDYETATTSTVSIAASLTANTTSTSSSSSDGGFFANFLDELGGSKGDGVLVWALGGFIGAVTLILVLIVAIAFVCAVKLGSEDPPSDSSIIPMSVYSDQVSVRISDDYNIHFTDENYDEIQV